MSSKLLPFLLASTLALGAVAARADGLSDAKAGLAALDAGDYTKAIPLFTSAINNGNLAHDDLELAHVKRGEAYGKSANNSAALQDLQKALALNASDAEALDAIMEISPGSCMPPKPAPEAALDVASGLFANYQKCVAEAGGDLALKGKLDEEAQTLIFAKVDAAGRRMRLSSKP